MCTNIATRVSIAGSAKASSGWVLVDQAAISYDHATRAWLDHALRIEFLAGPEASAERAAVEMDLESGKALLRELARVIQKADLGGVD